MIIKALNSILNKLGYKIIEDKFHEEYAEFIEVYEFCKQYTMTSVERMYALYKGVEYVVNNGIEGDFVECGVWKGGSAMLIAKTLQKFGVTDRKIWMYDTYEGMVEPSEEDKDTEGVKAHEIWSKLKNDDKSGWCVSSLEEVKCNLMSTNYPNHLLCFIQGMVEETIPRNIPNTSIALLRLDTDWYESTKHELRNLYPLLVQKGIFIIDDYGHWVGAKKALDEYLKETKQCLFLNKIDYTARIAIKV